eukprot:658354-Prymnesium_polylepis.8
MRVHYEEVRLMRAADGAGKRREQVAHRVRHRPAHSLTMLSSVTCPCDSPSRRPAPSEAALWDLKCGCLSSSVCTRDCAGSYGRESSAVPAPAICVCDKAVCCVVAYIARARSSALQSRVN